MSNTWHFSKGKPVRALLLPRVTPPPPAKAAVLSPLEMSRVRTRAALRGEGALRPPAAITSHEFQGKGEEDAETYARDLPLPTSSMSAPVVLSRATHNLGALWPIMERGWHAQSKTTSLPSDKHLQKLPTLIKLNIV